MEYIAFQINRDDNVATALSELPAGAEARLAGDAAAERVNAVEKIPAGHKIALRDISSGEKIIKYGVPIGRATANIPRGSWVHLHVMQSQYDERSSHLDAVTGAPMDTRYE